MNFVYVAYDRTSLADTKYTNFICTVSMVTEPFYIVKKYPFFGT